MITRLILLTTIYCSTLHAQIQPPSIAWQKSLGGSQDEKIESVFQTEDGGYIIGAYSNSYISGDKTENTRGENDLWIVKVDPIGEIEWQRTIGGYEYDQLSVVRETPDGGYIVGAYSKTNVDGEKTVASYGDYDYWIIKLSELGQIEWQKVYGGYDIDVLGDIENTNDGGYIVVGGSKSGISGNKTTENLGTYDYWVLKLNSAGNIEWEKAYGGSLSDRAWSVIQLSDGGYLIGGNSRSNSSVDKSENCLGSEDYWVLKVNAHGEIIWENTIGSTFYEYLGSLIERKNKNIVIGGYSRSVAGGDKIEGNVGVGDVWMVELDSLGTVINQNTIQGEGYENVTQTKETLDGGLILSCTSDSGYGYDKNETSRGINDFWVMKLDKDLNIRWQKTIGGSGADAFRALEATDDGGFLIAGGSLSGISGDKVINTNGGWDIWLVKVNPDPELAKNKIQGYAFEDLNQNCTKEQNEKYLPGVIIKATGDRDHFTVTNQQGYYELFVDSASSYTINASGVYYKGTQIKNVCPVEGYAIETKGIGYDTSNIYFGLEIEQCPVLSTEIFFSRLRRCFTNKATLTYRNSGAVKESGVKLFLQLPEYVDLISANRQYELFDEINNVYVFDIGDVPPFYRGTIQLEDSVICGIEEIRGYTQCIKSWIIPNSSCEIESDFQGWDESDVKVEEIECLGNSVSKFEITNSGQGDMLNEHEFRVYLNNELAYSDYFQLSSATSVSIEISADGSTIRLEADQHEKFPGKSRPRNTIEGCGASLPSEASLGFWPDSPTDDLDLNVSEFCLEISDSYDPNIKNVSPSGVTDQHFIYEIEPLKYLIQFQNTGTAPAINIKIADTLSSMLDLNTLSINGASHPYSVNITGETNPVLWFNFKDIYLPDSTTNEKESHGYISFTISPKSDIAFDTRIENFADIFFDYNSPIRTDTATITYTDQVVLSEKNISINVVTNLEEDLHSIVNVFPNPVTDKLVVTFSSEDSYQLKVFDMVSNLCLMKTGIKSGEIVDVSNLKPGLYILNFEGQNGQKNVEKMIKY